MLSVLFVPKAFTVARKNPEEVFPGAFRYKHRPGYPGRCGCLLTYAVPPAGRSTGSGSVLRPFPFW